MYSLLFVFLCSILWFEILVYTNACISSSYYFSVCISFLIQSAHVIFFIFLFTDVYIVSMFILCNYARMKFLVLISLCTQHENIYKLYSWIHTSRMQGYRFSILLSSLDKFISKLLK